MFILFRKLANMRLLKLFGQYSTYYLYDFRVLMFPNTQRSHGYSNEAEEDPDLGFLGDDLVTLFPLSSCSHLSNVLDLLLRNNQRVPASCIKEG